MSTPILILGASARAAAFSARRAKFAPRAIDLFGDADLRALWPATKVEDYPDGLLAAAVAAPPGPWMYVGGLENFPHLVEDLAARRPLWGNRGEVLARVRDALELADALARHGLPSPEVSSRPPAENASGTWLRKPRRSGGGIGIEVWTGEREVSHAGYYFQRFVEGTPCSAVYVAAGGRARLLGATRQLIGAAWTGAAPFHYAGSLGPPPLAARTTAELRRLGETLAREFGLVGLFGVDGVLADETFWTVEVNPRYTASVEVLERALGVAALTLHQQACRGNLPPFEPPPAPRPAGKAILFAREPIAPRAELWRGTLREQENQRRPCVADIPSADDSIPRGAPVTTLLAEGDDLAGVEAELQAAARRWEERIYAR
jgi:predicted ATP-grasp superfamily ATP-dependent carboligase